MRVRPAHRDYEKAEPHTEEWLLIEWPRSEAEPTKYWISTLPSNTALKALVKMAKHRWIVERDYQELKQELGLGHFEGRNWRGFHHHATLCIAAHGFLVAERNRFSPLPAAAILDSLHPGQHRTSARAGRRVRPERHNPNSIATLKMILARQLLGQLPQCPFCGRARDDPRHQYGAADTVSCGPPRQGVGLTQAHEVAALPLDLSVSLGLR